MPCSLGTESIINNSGNNDNNSLTVVSGHTVYLFYDVDAVSSLDYII